MSDFVVDETNNGATLAVHRADRILLRLSEVPTTGFRWRIEAIDNDAVALESEDFDLRDKASVGGGGIKTFVFRAVREGSSRLRLAKVREWDRGHPEVPSFVLTVQVGG